MAIVAGQILHDAQGFVIDRIQTGGVSNLNIPEEKIYELGNYQTVATVRDIPDLSFDLESFDVSTEIEAVINNVNPTTTVDGDEFDFLDSKPLDIISPFKTAKGLYTIVKGLALPYLTLENVTYRFGNTANSTQAYTLRGDSVYYIPGTPYYEQFNGTGAVGPFSFSHAAVPYHENTNTIHALGVCVHYVDGTYKRLFFGTDYTDTTSGFTLVRGTDAPSGSKLKVVYGSTVAATYPQTVHQNVSVKPAAVRGKNLDLYVGDTSATPTFTRWTGVQSFEVTRRVNLDNDQEFGNTHYVAQDYDTADVTGNVVVRPRTPDDLWDKIRQVANVPSNEVIGPNTSVFLPIELRIYHPDTGDLLKTLYVPDARFTVPAIQGRVQQKTDVTFNFASDGGTLLVYQGAR